MWQKVIKKSRTCHIIRNIKHRMNNSKLETPMKEAGFTVINKIDSGGYAEVYLVSWDLYPYEIFAAKVFYLEKCPDESMYESYIKEICSLKNLDHQNIIKFFKYFKVGKIAVLIFEYCSNGNMLQEISKHGPMEEEKFIHVAKQCLEGVKACHLQNVTHRDIKPANILIDRYKRIKLTDFGLSSILESGATISNYCGSYGFLAPEIICKVPYDPRKADIFSLGVTFCYFLSGTLPWDTASKETLFHSICKNSPILPRNISGSLKIMLDMMLSKIPDKRPTAAELLELPLFEKSCLPPLTKCESVYTARSNRRRKRNGSLESSNSQVIMIKRMNSHSNLSFLLHNVNPS